MAKPKELDEAQMFYEDIFKVCLRWSMEGDKLTLDEMNMVFLEIMYQLRVLAEIDECDEE